MKVVYGSVSGKGRFKNDIQVLNWSTCLGYWPSVTPTNSIKNKIIIKKNE